MTNRKHILLIVGIISIISCTSQKNTSIANDSVYEVINRTLEIAKENRIKNYETYKNKSLGQKLIKKFKNETKKLYPFFIKFNPNRARYSTYNHEVDTTFIFSLIDYKSLKYCDSFEISHLKLLENKNHYIQELMNAPVEIDFNKLSKRYEPFHTKLRESHHIKTYNANKDFLNEKQRKSSYQSLLNDENPCFSISYPVFSKDFKRAMILIDNDFLGGEIWFLKLINGKWERECYIVRIHY